MTSLDTPGYTLFSEVLSIYVRFAAIVHTHFSTPICVYDDSNREYICHSSHSLLYVRFAWSPC